MHQHITNKMKDLHNDAAMQKILAGHEPGGGLRLTGTGSCAVPVRVVSQFDIFDA